MHRKTLLAAAAAVIFAAPALADPIEGNWRTGSGETAAITKCGNAYCVTLKTGKHAGMRIGRMTGGDGRYKGKITDPAEDKTYDGKGNLSGSSLVMKGCVFFSLVCRGETWKRM